MGEMKWYVRAMEYVKANKKLVWALAIGFVLGAITASC